MISLYRFVTDRYHKIFKLNLKTLIHVLESLHTSINIQWCEDLAWIRQ